MDAEQWWFGFRSKPMGVTLNPLVLCSLCSSSSTVTMQVCSWLELGPWSSVASSSMTPACWWSSSLLRSTSWPPLTSTWTLSTSSCTFSASSTRWRSTECCFRRAAICNLPVLWLIYACVSVDVGAPKIPLLTFVTVKTIGVFLVSSFCSLLFVWNPKLTSVVDYYQFFCLVKPTSTRRFMEEGHTAWFDMEPMSSSSAPNAARFF